MNFPEAARSAVLLLLLTLLMGCASGTGTQPENPNIQAALPDVQGYGFGVRHHDTAEPLERVHEILDQCAFERLTDETWESHGIEVLRLRQSDLGLIADRLPASGPPGLIWHGQALTWRNLKPPATPVGDREMITGSMRESYPTALGGIAGPWMVDDDT